MAKKGVRREPLEFPKDREAFLQKSFEASDGFLSVGGWAHEFKMLISQERQDEPTPSPIPDFRAQPQDGLFFRNGTRGT